MKLQKSHAQIVKASFFLIGTTLKKMKTKEEIRAQTSAEPPQKCVLNDSDEVSTK